MSKRAKSDFCRTQSVCDLNILYGCDFLKFSDRIKALVNKREFPLGVAYSVFFVM